MNSQPREMVGRFKALVEESAARLGTRVINTPVVRLPWLDGPGREVWAKLECWQRLGTFKIRGAYNALLQLAPGQPVIAASAGNHGLGVAAVASELGLPCKICVPVNASELKVRRLLDAGAEVVPVGRDLFAATRYAGAEAARSGWHMVSAYADRDVIAGQGTCALEVFEGGGRFDTVLVPLGGGGLLAGVGSYLRAVAPSTRLVAVYPKVFGRQVGRGRVGEQLARAVLPTFADGLAVQVEPDNWVMPLLEELVDDYVGVDEDQIRTGIYALLHNQGVLGEGAAAVGVAALLDDLDARRIQGRVLVLISGGNISSTQLTQAMSVHVSDARVRGILGLRGVHQSLELPRETVAAAPPAGGRLPDEEGAGGDDVAGVWRSLVESAFDELEEIGRELRCHREYVEALCLRSDGVVFQTMRQQAELAADLALSCRAEAGMPVWQLRGRYRLLIQQLSLLRCGLQWCSASQDQNLEVMFYDPAEQRHANVNYARYGTTALRSLELHLTDALGFDPERSSLLATSSGQAAYQVIESFLLREVLRPGDRIAYAPYIYFEAYEQMSALPGFTHAVSPSYDVDDIIRTCEESDARVLFVDPLANIANLPAVDLRELARRTSGRGWADRWLVIDGTMVSGGCNPFEWFDSDDHPRVLYYESGSKYLQMGMDLQMAGLCVSAPDISARLYRHRRNTGTTMYSPEVAKFPRYDRAQFLTRMSALTRNARRLVSAVQESALAPSELMIGFPLNWRELGWRHGGGLVTLFFNEEGFNNRDRLEGLIELLLRESRERGAALTKGVSFGFGVTRVSAASAMAENTDPFLRFSLGEESEEEMERLCEAVVRGLKIYTEQGVAA